MSFSVSRAVKRLSWDQSGARDSDVTPSRANPAIADWPRVTVVTECYPRPGKLGDCAFVHRQLVGVRRAGCAVRVLVPNGWYPPLIWRFARAWRTAHARATPSAWSLDKIDVRDVKYQNRVPGRLSYPRDMNSRVARALVHDSRIHHAKPERDILLCQFALPYGMAVREAASALGLAYVVHLRGDDVWVWPHQSPERLRTFVAALSGARMVVAVSQSLIDQARRLTGDTLPATAVVPNGIDLHRFRPAASTTEREGSRGLFGIRDDELVVLCVGDALRRKGWIELIEALGRVIDTHRRVMLLGLEARETAELNLVDVVKERAPRLRFVRRVGLSDSQLVAAYQAADVFCLPSHWEGIANALLEALAVGLPVVTTAVAGHPEVITDGQEGHLVPPRDVERLTEALLRLVESPELRGKLSRAARTRAERIGNSDQAGERLAMLLRGIMRGHVDHVLGSRDPYACAAEH